MEDVDFSDEFCRFVQAHVPGVDVAEALLAQYRLNNIVRAPGFSDEEIARTSPRSRRPTSSAR